MQLAAADDIRIAGGTWTGEYSGGIKIQPDPTNSYFQFQGDLYFRRGSDGSNRLHLTSGGNLTAQGSVDSASDLKLKTNVITIENALDKVLQLRGVEFDRVDMEDHQIGLIAQEVEKIIPEVVHGDETKSVSYGNLVGLLIEAIKELKKEIDDLKSSK